jgi:flavin-dependent dehydrogenase
MTQDRSASEVELRPIRAADPSYDVAILGGGLAGLTLAIQLKRWRPQTSVVVLEKREGPAPDAAFKVGESTVPSGSHYFQEIVGMRDNLLEEHIVKCGLRYWVPTEDNADITKRLEAGPILYPPHQDFQIDRGRFENELARRALAAGVHVLQGCRVKEVDLGSEGHTISYTQMESQRSTQARWVVDAAGRASLLKRKLGLSSDVNHTINSAWLRLAGGLDLEQWGAHDEEFMSRMSERGIRQFSTNHLLGEGYWVWLIPLGSGPISIGICADPRYHAFEEMNELDRMVDWLKRHEPQLGEAIAGRLSDVQDFLRVEDFAYGVKQTYSADRWALVGEAAAFADPFYSPGSDFIAYGNCFTGDLIVHDLDGDDITGRLDYYNDFYQRTFATVLARTEDHYATFGNPWAISAKLVWDGTMNHYGTVLMMVKGKIPDFEFMKSVDADIDRLYRLNTRMQQLLREWRELERWPIGDVGKRPPPRPVIAAIFALAQDYDDDALREVIAGEVRTAEAMAVAFFHRAAGSLAEPPDPDRAVNPYAVSLRPKTWESDGLFESPGLTREQAIAGAEGIADAWLDPSLAKV